MVVRVVRVRHVRMHMPARVMAVRVTMRTGRHGVVYMIVVSVIVAVRVLMLRQFVPVLVSVRLSQVQQHACEH